MRQQFHLMRAAILAVVSNAILMFACSRADSLRALQEQAFESGGAAWGHWGIHAEQYSGWTNHSGRLVPIYTFGLTLDGYKNDASIYRDKSRLAELYGRQPKSTWNPSANYLDQTQVFTLQEQAVAAGKKYIILLLFDGLDWEMTRAAAIYQQQRITYRKGRGTGLAFLDYAGATTDFGYFVSSPHNDGTTVCVDGQVVLDPGGTQLGGFDYRRAGSTPWDDLAEPGYLIAKDNRRGHPYTDSASAATAMMCGIKTYNGAVNVNPLGASNMPIARRLQQERGWSTGVVTSVPISHATPGCAYANNVSRDDFQDITRDLLGLRSSHHRSTPLRGLDVLIGCGWGEDLETDEDQGINFVPGNRYLTSADLVEIDVRHGGHYEVIQRSCNTDGGTSLRAAAERAATNSTRLFGFFGVKPGHLPFRTGDGGFNPTIDAKDLLEYSKADLLENPTLAEMTSAALQLLELNQKGFWLMVEAGDVDWAAHANNIDNVIGAVQSGCQAFDVITQWAERNDCWDQTAVIVTGDHGHLFFLHEPERLLNKPHRESDNEASRP